MPVSAIHVNIVDGAKGWSSERSGVEKTGKAEKVREPVKKKEKVAISQKKKTEAGNQKLEVKRQKAKMAIPEPVVKEKAVGQELGDRSQKSLPPNPSPIEKEGEARGGRGNQGREVMSPGGGSEHTQGVQGAGLGPGGAMVSGPVVDIPDFKYDYYLGVIRNKIDTRWSQPIAYTRMKQALVEFTIHRNGEIANVRVSESSGDYYFDQTALRAVSLSNPFPPLPRGYKENFLKVRYRFIFGGKG